MNPFRRIRGFSLVEMLVVIAIISTICLVCRPVYAGTVTEPTVFRDRVSFRGSTGPDFDADNSFSIGGTKVEATAAQLNSAAVPASAVTTASVTNGGTLTLSAATPVVVISTAGQADGYTNTITIARPYPANVRFVLISAIDNTNRVGIADSTTVMALGSDAALKATDTLTLFTVSTNSSVKLSGSSN